MRGFATHTEVEAILSALAVSSVWLGVSFCNVGGVGLSFCLACVCASTVRNIVIVCALDGELSTFLLIKSNHPCNFNA